MSTNYNALGLSVLSLVFSTSTLKTRPTYRLSYVVEDIDSHGYLYQQKVDRCLTYSSLIESRAFRCVTSGDNKAVTVTLQFHNKEVLGNKHIVTFQAHFVTLFSSSFILKYPCYQYISYCLIMTT